MPQGENALLQNNDTIPNFKHCFDVLARNRKIYNQYNDSIFLIKEHNAWVSFFKHRAIRNQQVFLSNREAINAIKNYFKKDEAHIDHEAYVRLWDALREYLKLDLSDPFLILEVGGILDKHYQSGKCPNPNNHSSFLNVWMGTNYLKIYNLGSDTAYVGKAYQYFKRNLQNDKNKGEYIAAYFNAIWSLSNTMFLNYKYETLEEYKGYIRQMGELLKQESVKNVLSKDHYNSASALVKTADENVLRNVYMLDSTIMEKRVADSLMRKVVDKNLAQKELTDISYMRTQLMMVKLGRTTASRALECCLERYKKKWKNIRRERLSIWKFSLYIQPLYTLFYINDIAEIPQSKKRRNVKKLCLDIEAAFRNREDQQSVISYVKRLNTLTTYTRITKYLTYDERIHFLNALNVATQVTTYAHSQHVAMIAVTLMEGILKYDPEILVGTMGYNYVTDIKRDRRKLSDFIYNAAMYHDLGKNSIISVVNNDYRPITDEEFKIIKRHPELGLQYLELVPSLAQYHDTTLGHHKWYNGKGGYPDNFDNTQSPIRTMIDIVTLSDCMQAATERVGRNYKGEKTFENVMEEFRRDAGVRYNPKLVAFLDEHPDVSEKLAHLIEGGWIEIYYKIYQKFFM